MSGKFISKKSLLSCTYSSDIIEVFYFQLAESEIKKYLVKTEIPKGWAKILETASRRVM